MKKNLLFLAFACITLVMGCTNEVVSDIYLVTIDIQSPVEAAVVPLNQPMPVKVVFTRADNATIHHVNVYIVNTANQPIATLFEDHVHIPGEYTFETTYTPNQTGSFKLQAVSTDDAEESPNLRENSFQVQ
ncbi:MAG: hypothetical protein IPJ40_07920 [Saprospirales bacterium]|nr:hypothetical protein [Saprospirales bacterium]